VRAFLAAIEGMGIKRAMKVTSVDRNVIQRLRAGRAGDVKGGTMGKMLAYLQPKAPERVA
jgi:hypothetical protein